MSLEEHRKRILGINKNPEHWLTEDSEQINTALDNFYNKRNRAQAQRDLKKFGFNFTTKRAENRSTGTASFIEPPEDWDGKIKPGYQRTDRAGANVRGPKFDIGDNLKNALSNVNLDMVDTPSKPIRAKAKPRQTESEVIPASPADGNGRETPWTELASAVALANPEARTKDDIRNSEIPETNIRAILGYLNHLDEVDDDTVAEYLNNFRKATRNQGFEADSNNIWVSGKAARGGNVLPDNLSRLVNPKDTGDVFYLDKEGKLRTLDVKTTGQDYIGSPVIKTFLNEMDPERMMGDESSALLLKFLKENGIPGSLDDIIEMYPEAKGFARNKLLRSPDKGGFLSRSLRDQWSLPFQNNRNNPYWAFVESAFRDNPSQTVNTWLDNQYPDDDSYQRHRFNGETIEPLNRKSQEGHDFSIQRTLNPSTPDSNDSKSWYTVSRDNQPFRKFEVRRNDAPWTSHKMAHKAWKDNDQLIPYQDS